MNGSSIEDLVKLCRKSRIDKMEPRAVRRNDHGVRSTQHSEASHSTPPSTASLALLLAMTTLAATNYHTGWPATELFLHTADSPVGIPQLLTVPGERNAIRLGSYSRVDLRAERSMDTATGRFRLFVETTNLLERANPCCVEYDLEHAADGTPFLAREVGRGVPRFLSAGVRWEF